MFGEAIGTVDVSQMVTSLVHRGPDHQAVEEGPGAVLGHTRLRVLDLTAAADQSYTSSDGRFVGVFNGEVYNYRELRTELGAVAGRTTSDTEVVISAYQKWGPDCLDRFIGMFAFIIWDRVERTAFFARDRFGVKPLYLVEPSAGGLVAASEIAAFHAVGIGKSPDLDAWATYLATGRSDFEERTFWRSVRPLPAGSAGLWKHGRLRTWSWYDPVERATESDDQRPRADVASEVEALLRDTVRLRFRSDVPAGICLSGGLDSSTLLSLVHAVRGADDDVTAFTFTTGDPDYDELPWVRRLLDHTNHELIECQLRAEQVPQLAASVHRHVLEPYGGVPTLAYAQLFEHAKSNGVTVLLDGQGLDEAFAGYDYFRSASVDPRSVQGSVDPPFRPEVLSMDALRTVEAVDVLPPARSRRTAMQLRDLTMTKLPRALRFNDRISMRSSRELREPFLDHRLVELGLAQPDSNLMDDNRGKLIIRDVVRRLVPGDIVQAPKRPVQTPQREWIRGPLRPWVIEQVDAGLEGPVGCVLAPERARDQLRRFLDGHGDNSFFVWQLVSAGLLATAGDAS